MVVQLPSCVRLAVTPWTEAVPCPLSAPWVCSNLCPLSRWCHPTISFSVTPFSSCFLSVPASWFFPVSQLFASGGQSIGASASASVLPMNTQDWFPLRLTGLFSLPSKGTVKNLLQYHSLKASVLSCSANLFSCPFNLEVETLLFSMFQVSKMRQCYFYINSAHTFDNLPYTRHCIDLGDKYNGIQYKSSDSLPWSIW